MEQNKGNDVIGVLDWTKRSQRRSQVLCRITGDKELQIIRLYSGNECQRCRCHSWSIAEDINQ